MATVNKVLYTAEDKKGVSFTIECEDSQVLERLSALMLPYYQDSEEPKSCEPPVTNLGPTTYRPVTICNQTFLWPEWLKGKYIAMDKTGYWYVFEDLPALRPVTWQSEFDRFSELRPKLFNIFLPTINSDNWNETLTENPWNG